MAGEGGGPAAAPAPAPAPQAARAPAAGTERSPAVPELNTPEGEYQVYEASKGWVKDAEGRFHEVDDVERFLQSYPGSEKVKSGDVVKSKVGYAEPKVEAAQG